ncbi:amidase domain-containing protein [Paenibacillus cisolokensis]|uniref:amidase domain-containing protein n=1 Tax=Paenibacillus cisolokensis TaxID=1658519 RepID=UPI003D275D0E
MKRGFLAISAFVMLFVLTTNVSASAEGKTATTLSVAQEKKLNSFFKQRGDLLKAKKISKTLTKKDEAFGLVNFMDDIYGNSLSDYQVDYKVKDISVVDNNQIVTAEIYQTFSWSGLETKTVFKDEVQILISDSGEIQIDFPQMEVDADELVSNARTKASVESNEAETNVSVAPTVAPAAVTYTYNRTAVQNYVDKYWDNYNPDYIEYSNDCTNFASQAIHAGGIPMYIQPNGSDYNPSWYYNINAGGWLRSLSWINVDELFDLLRNYSTIDAVASNLSGMAIGDIIQYDKGSDGDKNHTAIVSYIETPAWDPSKRYVYVSYHTTDRHNVLWDFYASSYPNTSTYFTHILDTQTL